MYQILVSLGVPKKLVKLIEICINGYRGRFRIGGNVSEPFLIRDGLKEGDGLSTVLFKLTLEYAVRKMQVSELGATLNGTVQILGYADNLDIVGHNREGVSRNAEILIDAAKATSLEVSESKTKYMIMDRRGTCAGQGDLRVRNFNFEKVSEFRYLGATITDRNEIKAEIARKLHAGNACFYSENKLLRSKLLSKENKITIFGIRFKNVLGYSRIRFCARSLGQR